MSDTTLQLVLRAAALGDRSRLSATLRRHGLVEVLVWDGWGTRNGDGHGNVYGYGYGDG